MSADLGRLTHGYEPSFDRDYEFGRQGELWIADIAAAFPTERVEVKTDARAAETGNLFIEYASCNRAGWEASGIGVTRSEIWAHVLRTTDFALITSTDLLLRVARECWQRPALRAEMTQGSNPTRGVLVPIWRLIAELRKAA